MKMFKYLLAISILVFGFVSFVNFTNTNYPLTVYAQEDTSVQTDVVPLLVDPLSEVLEEEVPEVPEVPEVLEISEETEVLEVTELVMDVQIEEGVGSIRVCKVILDTEGNAIAGEAGTTFSFSEGTLHQGVQLPATTFTTPLNLNSDVVPSIPGNDAECVMYENLTEMTTYLYGPEIISPSDEGWDEPLYNDQYDTQISDLGDFYTYNQNIDSNGGITIEPGHIDRTFVVLNKMSSSTATIVTTKIVCDSEADLPNWGAGGPDITASTASDFLANHPNCHEDPNWKFAWSLDGVGNPGDHVVGTVGDPWHTFTGSTEVPTGNLLWVREEFQNGFIGFGGQNTTESVSAEMYCHTDVLNYDNWDFINPIEAGETYHCVGFNVVAPSACGVHEMDVYSDVSNMVDGNNAVLTYNENPSWTASISGADWIWDTFYVQNPTQEETRVFSKSFNVAGDVTSATLYIAADNTYKVSLNSFANVFSATDSNDAPDHNFTSTGQDSYDVISYLIPGANTISFEITNLALEGGTEFSNPAGLLYRLHIVSDDCGDQNNPPVANANVDQTLTLPTNSTNLDGSLSTDSDGTIVSYVWTFVSGPTNVDPSDVVNPNLTGLTLGTYVFSLTVTDNDGATGTDTMTVVVNQGGGGGGGDPICSDGLDNDGDNLIDFPADEGCESADDNSEDNRRTIGGGGTARRGGGQVLGAQSVCDFAIDTYMRRGYDNDREQVKILQTLLNKYVGSNLVVDGYYGPMTESAVEAFQVKYEDNVLDPWEIEDPTGIFFRTTLVQAQNLECPDLGLPVPENLINWSESIGEVPAPLPVPIPLSFNYYYGI